MRSCGACGRRVKKLQAAVILTTSERKGYFSGMVGPCCARNGILLVCGDAHLKMSRARKSRGSFVSSLVEPGERGERIHKEVTEQ
jgi:hypothetical protein